MGAGQGRAGAECTDLELGTALWSLVSGVARTVPRDLSSTAVAALNTLERLGPTRLTRLAAIERVAQPSMTAIVSRLETEGLVERRPDESDRRAVLVGLTGEGASYLARRREAAAGNLAALIASLPPEEASLLRRALPAISHLAAAARTRPREAAARTWSAGPLTTTSTAEQ